MGRKRRHSSVPPVFFVAMFLSLLVGGSVLLAVYFAFNRTSGAGNGSVASGQPTQVLGANPASPPPPRETAPVVQAPHQVAAPFQPAVAQPVAAPAPVRSELIGGTGGGPFESARSGEAVLGFNYRFGEWANQPSISAIAAVYGAEPIPPGHQQVLAKDDYAVGGLQIELKQYVTGFRVVFMKRGVNGRLDPNDQYLSDWIRAGRIPGKPQAPLVSDGRLVIGIHGRAAAVVDALGLVFE